MTPLPGFRHPPVTEVVIAVRFKRVSSYSLPELCDLSCRLGEGGFKKVEEHAGYEAPMERFGEGVGQSSWLSLELLNGPPPVRYWFLNETEDELLQVQSNWFAANWRKVSPTAQYGRWEARWDAFQRWLSVVEDAVADHDLEFDQVEVTYVNHIVTGSVWNSHGDAPSVFRSLAATQGVFLSAPEQYSTDITFVIGSPSHEGPLGRLHVAISPGLQRPAGAPLFVMNLTARGAPIGSGHEGIQTFANLAHEWIVRGFTDLTTNAMHEVWEREQ